MRKVGISDLRQHLPSYLERVRKGEPIQITQNGKVVARLVPEQDAALEARQQLDNLRKTSRIGDVLSPIGERWESEHGRV